MDALTHAIEALCVDMYHPMCDGISLEAIRIIYEFLPKAYYHGDDIEARSQMLTGSAMAAVAFQKGLGAVHGKFKEEMTKTTFFVKPQRPHLPFGIFSFLIPALTISSPNIT